MRKKQVTIVDVAQEAGVSYATVSNVLNRRDVPLAEETIRRVEEAARRLGYRRNAAAASLSRQRSNELGLLLPGFGEYFGRFAEAMERTAYAHGYHLSVFSSSHHPELEQRHLEMMLQRRVDGLFCHGLALSPETTRLIVGDGTPIVLFNAWDWPPDIAIGVVNPDFRGACRGAVRHLYDRGCRSFAFAGGLYARATGVQRRLGFADGIASLPETVASAVLELDNVAHAEWPACIMAACAGGEPLGFVAFDDTIASRAMWRLQEQGIAVPERVKIVGVNNDSFAAHCHPGLTSIAISHERHAELAIGMMVAHLEGRTAAEAGTLDAAPSGERTMPLELIVRGSSA
ncbi:LacI family DNA-binding transcriptional regulator [Paenibacillus cymbidii]|uniref:LacI family DNA-binding transcriptional regulator n=1 Tax=Paenibacillus cymbidii TaxID=1639034 RepID=UPI00108091B6|nr:LacI family DNA-binding transcriptional regulator [Paenibacillus cymbidii]